MIKEILGRPVNPGNAVGKAYVLRNSVQATSKETIENAEAEVNRLNIAINSVTDKLKEQLFTMYDEVLNCHLMILADDTEASLKASITNYIYDNKVNAEYAISAVTEIISKEFGESSDEYLSSRAEDISHISRLLLSNLCNGKPIIPPKEPSVIFAPELSPEEFFSLNPKLILGIVTRKGSALSHTAILARSMGIPFISGVEIGSVDFGNVSLVAIDAGLGIVYFNPDKDIRDKMSNAPNPSSFESLKASDMKIMANINTLEDAESAFVEGADGIGLFRTEFLFMNRDSLPTEDEQYEIYSKLSDIMKGRPVTIRTLDTGSDKTIGSLPSDKEPNPALGIRGIRFGLANPDVLKTQIKAVLRASSERTNIRIMFPMITSEWEVIKLKEMIEEASKELKSGGYEYGLPAMGIMIETPAAALISDKLSKLVDFVSIGTNDLAQYTLAADRTNDEVGEYLNLKHEAVMHLIETTAANARANNIPVGICGEIASDVSLYETFTEYGINELSMPYGLIRNYK